MRNYERGHDHIHTTRVNSNRDSVRSRQNKKLKNERKETKRNPRVFDIS